MTIQKKSLISSLNTTKKAIVASSPATGSAAPAVVKAGVNMRAGYRLARKEALGKKTGAIRSSLATKLGKK